MAGIGDGYGSECHLLRWMGRHRNLFDEGVSAAVGRPGDPINWLDFNFAPNKKWPDAELKGLEFLYDRPGLKEAWEKFWPTGGGVQNWDAVGWIGTGPDAELLLVEAKANIEEMKSDCHATSTNSIRKIEQAFKETKESLSAALGADWFNHYYQAANRMAALYFVQREQILGRLLFIYFCGDQVPGKECPRTADEWKPAIDEQWGHLGLAADHRLADRTHELFLPISS